MLKYFNGKLQFTVDADISPFNYLQQNLDAGVLNLAHCSAASQNPSKEDIDV